MCVEHDTHVLQRAFFMPEGEVLTANDPLSCYLREMLASWCRNPETPLHAPLAPAPTAFQQAFREALLQIPSGCTVSYGELAKVLRSSPRAVGQACRLNPLVLFVPCHRVLARSGLGGYMGLRTPSAIKMSLLRHENPERADARDCDDTAKFV